MGQLERIIIILANKRGLTPINIKHFKKQHAGALGRISMRVTASTVEVGVLAGELNKETLRRLEESIGEIVEKRRIGSSKENPIDAYVGLVKKQRYWEAHEVLENLWSRNRNPMIQGLIQIAAAQAKAQEGRLKPALRILKRALNQPGINSLFDSKCLVRETIKTYVKGYSNILACIRD